MSGRMDRAFDAGVAGFALWTLCAHASVALGASLDTLMVGGSVVLVGAGGFALWLARHGRPEAPDGLAGEAPAEPQAPVWARAGVAAGAAACAVALAAGAPLPVVWTLAALLVAFACARELSSPAGRDPEPVAAGRAGTAVLAALSVLCVGVVLVAHRPDADDAFYLNLAVAAVDDPSAPLLATDSLHRVAGAPLTLPVYRVHSYELAVAALARISGRPVLDVAHLFLPALLAAFVPFVHARVLRRLVPRAWPTATAAAVATLLFTAVATHGWANFGLVRLHQGKGLLLTLLLPAVVAYALELSRSGGVRAWLRLAAAQVAAVGVSASALWLAPLVAGPALLAGLRSLDAVSLRRLAAGGAASLYVGAVALALRADTVAAFRDAPIQGPEQALDSLRLAGQAWRAVMAPGTVGAFLLLVVVGSWAFTRGATARRLFAFSTATTLVLWNPFAADWIAANLTSAATYWRVLWLLPLPAMLALLVSAPISWKPGPTGRALAAAAALGVFGGAVLVTPRAVAIGPANPVRLAIPGWKVPPRAFEAARWIAESAAPGDTVLAPRRVAPWLATFHHYPTPLVVRAEYLPVLHDVLGPEELRRRMLLLRVVSGDFSDPRALAVLDESLRSGELSVVALSKVAGRAPGLPRLLAEAGFQKIHENADYEVWRRRGDAEPGGHREG